jgi:dihydroorotate dehydrogenase electron transfer subunit
VGSKGDAIRLLGPGGQPIWVHANRPRVLLMGEGPGIGPTLYLAEQLHSQPEDACWQPVVLLGSDTPFPFRPRPSVIVVPGIPTGVIACMPLLEEWGTASRLASPADFPGCFEGPVTELAHAWLGSLTATELAQVEIVSCGPAPMLEACASLARGFGLPCQVSRDSAPTA